MTLDERVAAVEACRWVTRAIPHAPYVTSLAWISHYGCKYVGHGDTQITHEMQGWPMLAMWEQSVVLLMVR